MYRTAKWLQRTFPRLWCRWFDHDFEPINPYHERCMCCGQEN